MKITIQIYLNTVLRWKNVRVLCKVKLPKTSNSIDFIEIYIKQVYEGLLYMHSLGLIHGDIAARNILLCGPEESLTAKITDFGLTSCKD